MENHPFRYMCSELNTEQIDFDEYKTVYKSIHV